MKTENQLKSQGLIAGVVWASDVKVKPTDPALKEKISQLIELRKTTEPITAEFKGKVRDLLRRGGFKPTGRSKPASEYLDQTAREDRYPWINNLVDINNYISLLSGFSASLVDSDVTTNEINIRLGRSGERYVFNSSNQDIDLENLICVCRLQDDTPLANPVKDSMAAKLKDHSQNVVGIIYASNDCISEDKLKEYLSLFSDLLKIYGGAKETTAHCV